MRTAFITKLIELARKDESIFLIVGDLGFSVVEPFAKEFPNRFLNAGIAEQNMTGVAAGLAMSGYKVFTYSIGNFPTLRALEQIRNDICYHNLNVNIVSVGAGFSYGSLGVSHHATEDIGIMRSLPNMRVFSPGDPVEARLVTEYVIKNQGPSYLRLGKAGEKLIHSKDENYNITKFIKVKESINSNCAILITGSILSFILEQVAEYSHSYDIFSCPIIKPLDTLGILNIAKKYKIIITIEEHQIASGFGSAIVESISDHYNAGNLNYFPRVERIAINNEFSSYGGGQNYLRMINNLFLNVP